MIRIKVKGVELTLEEAKEVYKELKDLFSEDTNPLPTGVPWNTPYFIGPGDNLYNPYKVYDNTQYTTSKEIT